MSEKMDNEEDLQTQQMLVLLGRQTVSLRLPEFLECIAQAEAVGPILDPTLWLRGNARMENVKKLAEKLNAVREEVLRQVAEHGMVKSRGPNDEHTDSAPEETK